jgi:hypothetical protein
VDAVANAIARALDKSVPKSAYAKSRALVVLNAIAPGLADRMVKKFRKPVRRNRGDYPRCLT